MKVYHGSNTIVEKPELRPHNRFLDFGDGFYTTSNKKQAEIFANIVVRRRGGERIVNIFDFNETESHKLNVLRFETADNVWLDFISQNRNGLYRGEQYDIVCGPVANDRVYQIILLYNDGILSVDETLTRLKVFQLYNQIVFKSEHALSLLCCAGFESF
ncbi:MAG: DUF3990 domain-containing protein [Planctomycetaceae bacterium]|jgi:hypothetical protein|nr:DUF3990 domain-containing protein [Planctomycetaceae bacterium]